MRHKKTAQWNVRFDKFVVKILHVKNVVNRYACLRCHQTVFVAMILTMMNS